MDRAPGGAVTRCTVAASRKVLAIGTVRCYKSAAAGMTVITGIMSCRISAYKRWIRMTAYTVTSRLDK